MNRRRFAFCFLALVTAASVVARADESAGDSTIRVDFESATIGKPLESYTEKHVLFRLAHPPTKSKAVGRIMFFPHIASKRIGILNAMADDPIPLQVEFPSEVLCVELTMWGSTTSAAKVEAFDKNGTLLDSASRKQVPTRQRPEDAVPLFKLHVQAEGIKSVQMSGAQPGGFVAIDELAFTPQP